MAINTSYTNSYYNLPRSNNSATANVFGDIFQDQSYGNYLVTDPKENNYELDDGKIGFKRAAGNFLKGLVKPITSMFSSPGNFIKSALMIGGCAALCAITGGAAAPLLVAGGLAIGGLQLGKGAIKAMTAKTDAEAEAAWQDMGTGTFSVGASLIGAKSAVKAAGKAGVAGFEGAENASTLSAAKMCLKPSNMLSAGKASYSIAKGNISTLWNGTGAKNTETVAETDTKPTVDEKIEKMKADAKKQEINAAKQRQQQLEHNIQDKAKFEAKKAAEAELAQERAQVAREFIEEDGVSINELKKEGILDNLSHENKQIVKEAMQQAKEQVHQREISADIARQKEIAYWEEQNFTGKSAKGSAQVFEESGHLDQIAQEEFSKIAETNPEGYQKMVDNAAKTSANAAKRARAKVTSKPGYQRAYGKMQGWSKGKLENFINTSTNKSEIAAARDLLSQMTPSVMENPAANVIDVAA